MISHSARCVYIHIPKTGGHTIDRYFIARKLVSEGRWHATAEGVIELIGSETFSSYLTFATIRNPWDRFVSEYVWQASDCDTQIKTPWGNKSISFADFVRSDYHWYPHDERVAGHLRDQAHFIYDDNDTLLVNRLVRFENFQADFDAICSSLGLPTEALAKTNATQHEHYSHYYTPELAEIVGNRFARDIKLFGYRYGD